MYTSQTPNFSGPNAQMAAQRWAKLEVRLRILRSMKRAADYVLMESDEVPATGEFYSLQERFVESTVNIVQRRQEEKASKIELLTNISGVSYELAKHLINEFGSLESLAKANIKQIQIVEGVDTKLAETLIQEVPRLISSQ